MREIKFRGKRKDNGKWVYGVPIPNSYGDRVFIIPLLLTDKIAYPFERLVDWVVEVWPETISQYTGLKDKNGVEIFEGDLVRVGTQAKVNGEFPIGYVVRANDKPEMFIALPEQLKETGERQYHLENLYKHYSDEFEVIGNVYANSGLMEERK